MGEIKNEVKKVDLTEKASQMIATLKEQYGDLMFHQSGGCCDGSAPMCYPAGEFKVGQSDVYLGDIDGCPFYMSESQYEYWKHTKLTIDLVPGRGSGFSAEAPHGFRFLTRSELL